MSRDDDSGEASVAGASQQNGGHTSGANDAPAPLSQKEEKDAAEMIQRNYRGYRSRRQMAGMGLDANERWAEV